LKYYILSAENGIIMDEVEYDGLATLDGKYIQVRQGDYWGIFDLLEKKRLFHANIFTEQKRVSFLSTFVQIS